MRLLERDHPLRVLLERARRTAEGHGSLVLVAGEAGIGKTALLRAFAERIRGTSPPLWGMCDPLSTPRPLGPLRDVADELAAEVSALLRASAVQHEIFTAVLAALRVRPRVLVVEDLHWADEATLDLVRFLARRIVGLPLLLVLSYRDAVGPDHPLRPVLGDLVSAPEARRLQLAPLSRTAVAELLAGHGVDADDVHRRTAGNPFFVSQIVAQPDSPLPESVRDAVITRTAGLTAADRHWLELLSCAPDGVSGELLAALELPAPTVETLAATGLVDRRGAGVAFRHEIARSAVLDGTAPGVESTLHARMLEALERIGAEPSVLTHHAAAVGDAPRVLRHAPAAAAGAARSGAHREAVAFYETALRHAGDEPATRAPLLEALSNELYYVDRLRDAIEVRTQALELRRELTDVVAVGAAHRWISDFAWYAADRAKADLHDRAAVEILDGAGDHREFGFALANRAYLAAHRGDATEALRFGARAEAIADELDDAPLRASATVALSVARLLEGDMAARAGLFAARDTGLRHGIDELATAPMSNLAHLDVEDGRLQDADDVLVDALRLSTERGIPICTAWQRGVQARLRLLQGRWAEAEQDARAVLASGDIPLGRLWPHLVLGLLAVRREAPAENEHLDELWRLATRLDEPGKLAPVVAALAEQSWVTRRPDPRLLGATVATLAELHFAGRDTALAPLRRWTRRLADADLPHLAWPGPDTDPPAPADQPYEQALRSWDAGSPADLLAALTVLDDLGARAVSTRVRARLRELGVAGVPRGPAAATRSNPAGLTARQLDVLDLLVDGLSNAQIADRLVISPKTADHHVSAILAKLEVRSRGEAAAAARRLGV
ncbi:MAG: hypothetical protein QOI50_6074 [Pseudonocardiales bacterium]|nr:hypothetical protein [Pseudonocardiales bacterium]